MDIDLNMDSVLSTFGDDVSDEDDVGLDGEEDELDGEAMVVKDAKSRNCEFHSVNLIFIINIFYQVRHICASSPSLS